MTLSRKIATDGINFTIRNTVGSGLTLVHVDGDPEQYAFDGSSNGWFHSPHHGGVPGLPAEQLNALQTYLQEHSDTRRAQFDEIRAERDLEETRVPDEIILFMGSRNETRKLTRRESEGIVSQIGQRFHVVGSSVKAGLFRGQQEDCLEVRCKTPPDLGSCLPFLQKLRTDLQQEGIGLRYGRYYLRITKETFWCEGETLDRDDSNGIQTFAFGTDHRWGWTCDDRVEGEAGRFIQPFRASDKESL